jgi:hypothetical protein
MRRDSALLLAILLGLLAGSTAETAWPSRPQGLRVDWPPGDAGAASLAARRQAQLKAAAALGVFHGFSFTDRRAESGITFRDDFVDDAGKHYKAVHYDHGNGVAVADVDGDGLYDIYFVGQLGGSELWRNRGNGAFENVTARAGVALADRIAVSASFADVDNDGDPDLFVTTVRGGNCLFANDGRGVFRDVTRTAGLDYSGHSSAAVFFDYDRGGGLDLFLANVGKYTTDEIGRGGYRVGYTDAFAGHTRPERTEYSILYRNLGGVRFRDVSREVGLRDPGWSGDAAFHDLDRDGYPDLYVLNMQGGDHHYENLQGKKFRERTAKYFPRTPWGSMGIKFFDYDNDGRPDSTSPAAASRTSCCTTTARSRRAPGPRGAGASPT